MFEYNFSAVSVCSNPYVGLLLRIGISFSLLSICEDELISTPIIITFLPTSSLIEKNPFLSNPVPYPEYLYRPISICFTVCSYHVTYIGQFG